jgi:adenylate kinase family enzyme
MVWTIKDIVEVIEKCIANKFDAIIFIEGNRGLGKSTLAYKISSRLNIPMPFRPKRDVVYTQEDTIKHLATKKGGVIFSDELINVAYLRDFYSEGQKTLIKALNLYRDSCNVFIGCIPKFIELDKAIQRLCKIRITVVRRGVAIIQTQMRSIYSADSWDIKNNQKIESRWSVRGNKQPQYAKLTTVRGILRFGDLTAGQREEYEAIKQEKRGQVFGKYNDVEMLNNPEKIFYDNLLTQVIAHKITPELLETIATINAKEVKNIRARLSRMLKEKNDLTPLKDYIMNKEKKEKRDKLGFVIKSSEQAFEMPELVPAGLESNDKPMQEPEIEQEDTTQLNKEDGFEGGEDIFGFAED